MGARDLAIRLVDSVRALQQSRKLVRHDAWSRAELEAFQRRAYDELRRDLSRRSDFWRVRLAAEVPPALDKATLMERFDEIVTDPRLRLARLEAHLTDLTDEDTLLDREFRVMATGGTTGHRGLFVYSRPEWRLRIGSAVRFQTYAGLGRLPPRRIAMVGTTRAVHISGRYAMSAAAAWHTVLAVDARRPVSEIGAELEAFQPGQLTGYPSMLALLAAQQMEGRLAIAPRVVMTVGELRTEGMERAIREAWPGARLQDLYATTEGGVIGADCEREEGLHLFEDLARFDNVDEDGRPVPDGEMGAALLLTDLHLRAQPRVRQLISDAVVLTSEPCRCGRPFRRVVSIAGRSDDILDLPGRGGATVRLHPVALRAAMATQPHVVQYQVVRDRAGLQVAVVPRARCDASVVTGGVQAALARALHDAGADVQVAVRLVGSIERLPGPVGKVKVVSSAL